ncbi:VirB3 family type IV secretion system protein (plasmid) [Guyparkeria sp. 1SP6A2]|nr:VirB3 family type IV secretion system protein [Guyparkeria sp. 1SP6A2]
MPDPLFQAATRPAMKWGVTLEGIIFGGVAVMMVFIATKNPLLLFLYIPVHAAMYLMCMREPRIFRLLSLWAATKAKSLGWKHWGAATATPMVNTRAKRRMPK